MNTIPAGQFKARCLELMDQVNEKRVEFIITKRGKPVARLAPVPVRQKRRDLFGCMKGTVTILGDIISPLDDKWEADSDE